jgi:lipoate-protein ligase A
MALDGVAAETVASGGPRTLRVYRWEPSTLSLGYGQAVATVDWDHCDRAGIDVTRRHTGGGGIYHDCFGDVSYSIVVPADEVPGDLLSCYSLLLEPVLDAFERMGVSACVAEEPRPAIFEPACYLRAVHPAHDVVVDGRKISGNAQYRRKDAVIQHGSITYARETDRHLAVFDGHDVEAEEFEERVTSVREQAEIERVEAVTALEDALAARLANCVGLELTLPPRDDRPPFALFVDLRDRQRARRWAARLDQARSHAPPRPDLERPYSLYYVLRDPPVPIVRARMRGRRRRGAGHGPRCPHRPGFPGSRGGLRRCGRVPGGDAYGRVENPKGELGYYITAKRRAPNPDRYHVRSPSFINLTALGKMCQGHKVADIVTILGSIDIVLGEVDR